MGDYYIMIEEAVGCFAYSLAGHDKGHIYLIIKEEKEYVYLSDGKIRTINNPKKKNKKHIQANKKYKENIASITNENKEIADETIRKAIKTYLAGNADFQCYEGGY